MSPPVAAPRVVLLSTYDLGRQPFGLASAAAWLSRAGATVTCNDLAVEPLDEAAVRTADCVAFHLPMHTATRLAARVVPRVRALAPRARLGFFGLYAAMNRGYLRGLGADLVIGGEFERALAERVHGGPASPGAAASDGRNSETATAGFREGDLIAVTLGLANAMLPPCAACRRSAKKRRRVTPAPSRSSASRSSRPTAAGSRISRSTRAWMRATARSSPWVTPRRAAAAGTRAGTARSCRSIAGSSASFRATW